MISWKGVSGWSYWYADRLSPSMRSYETLLNETYGRPAMFLLLRCSLKWVLPYRLLSVASLMYLASVDLPMPGRPTGMKKSFFTFTILFCEIMSTTNYKSVDSITDSSQLKGTATSYKIGAFTSSWIFYFCFCGICT